MMKVHLKKTLCSLTQRATDQAIRRDKSDNVCFIEQLMSSKAEDKAPCNYFANCGFLLEL